MDRISTIQNAKPIIKWAGSKKLVIPKIKEILGDYKFDQYIEPFVGSAQLYFSLNIKRNVISDINMDLINTYVRVRDNPDGLHRTMLRYKDLKEKQYYELRDLYNNTKNYKLKSALFIILNKYSFNGLYRTNLKGEFNVPYGYDKKRILPTRSHLKACSAKFKETKILCSDFESVILKYTKQNTLVYLDPPYSVENRIIFNQYNATNFGNQDLERIRKLLDFIHGKRAFFILSYSYSAELELMFSKWLTKKIFVKRNIAGFVDSRRKAAELLVTNLNL